MILSRRLSRLDLAERGRCQISPAMIGAIASRMRGGGAGGGGGGPPTDPDFASVVALLHMDGADASTTFLDHSPGSPSRVWTAANQAQIDTAQSKFGGASGLFDGTTDFISSPNHADFDFGSGDFTLECWVRLTTLATTQIMIGKRATATFAPFLLAFDTTPSAGCLRILASFTGSSWAVNVAEAAASITTDTWYHIAMVRNGTSFKGYIDGSEVVSATASGTLMVNTAGVSVGAGTTAGANSVNGWLDDVRITKGVARYTGNFSVPTSAFPNS